MSKEQVLYVQLSHILHTSSQTLDLIHIDVWGLVLDLSHDGYKYFIIFVNDFSFLFGFLLSNKNLMFMISSLDSNL